MTEYIRNILLRICSQPRSFEFISKSVNGLDPVETMQYLKEMEQLNELVQINNMWCIKEVSVNETLALFPRDNNLLLQKYMGYFQFLKNPHPLDFEWRNSSFSLNRLIGRITELVRPSEKILFLGMPTLFATAVKKDIPYKVRLVERNRPIIQGLNSINTDPNRFQIIEHDIFTVSPSVVSGHYCVVLDPPWYTPHFFSFMWLAANAIVPGGIVAISLPPINTRPNIIEERLEWFSYCKELGLCIETLEPQHLQYTMPFFEYNALRTAGITDILPFWRKGDLAIFRKTAQSEIQRPKDSREESLWIEREYKGSRIRVLKEKANNDVSFSFQSLVKGDILPTVSSRNVIRKQANVWTSGNRIFKCEGSQMIIDTIDLLKSESPLTEKQKVVEEFLDMVTNLEQKEFQEYLDWIYYEMERQAN